jgi:hypothetical protein
MRIQDLIARALEIRNVAATVVNDGIRDELNALADRFERLAFSADGRLQGKLPDLDLRPSAALRSESD